MSRARSVADLGNQNVLDLNASEGTLKVGAGVTIENTGEVQFAGIVTAATVQVGAATTLHSTGLDLGSGTLTCHNITSTGLLTYEDVTSVDSIGIITARSGIDVGTGTSISSPSSNVLTLGTAGSERLRIDSSSTISIGNLVSPASANIHLDLYCNSSYDAFIRFRDESGAPGLIGFDHGSNAMQFYTNGASPAMSIDSSDRMLLGLTSARATKAAASIPSFQIEGTVDSDSRMNIGRNSNSDNGPEIHLYKSRGTTLGSNTIVQDDDQLGSLLFIGADGSDLYSRGAEISAFVDGTPGNDDMPSRLVFSTCASGSAAATERMRIDSNGKLVVTDIGSTAFLSDANSFAQAMISSNVGGLIINSTDTTASSYCRLIFTPNGNLSGNEGLIRYNTNDYHMSFWTQANERMRIDSAGRMALGTTSPVNIGSGYEGLTINASSAGTLYLQGGGTSGGRLLSDGSHLYIGTVQSSGSTIIQRGHGSYETARFDSAGRFLVNRSTTASNGALAQFSSSVGPHISVNSTGVAGAFMLFQNSISGDGNGDGLYVGQDSSAAGYLWNYESGLYFGNNNATVGRFIGTKFNVPGVYNGTTTGGGPVYVESDGDLLRYTSSLKYKTDVETLEDERADAILNCRPVWYRSKCENDIKTEGAEKSDWGWYGFIAEEVAEIEPRLVNWATKDSVEQEDKTTLSVERDPADYEAEGVRYDNFVPLMLNLIKRQKAQIETLEQRLSDAGIA